MFEVTDNLGLTLLHRMDKFDTELLMLNLKKIDTAYGTSLNNITDAFDSTKEYAIGDYCIKDNVLYKFVSAKSVGDWDDSIVISTTISNVLKEINAEITQLNSNINLIKTIDFGIFSYQTETVDTVIKYILDTMTPADFNDKLTYICAFELGSAYRAIIQPYSNNKYSSAIVFSYAMPEIIYYQKLNDVLKKCTTQWTATII